MFRLSSLTPCFCTFPQQFSEGCCGAPKRFLGFVSLDLVPFSSESQDVTPSAIAESTKIFVNGAWVGVHRDPQLLVSTLRQLRRQVGVDTEVGVVPDVRNRELRLYTDAGRLCRPLFVVEEGKLVLKKRDVQALLANFNTEVRSTGWLWC